MFFIVGMLQDLQVTILLCVHHLHIQTSHCELSCFQFFPSTFFEKVNASKWKLVVVAVVVFVTVSDITQYYGSAVKVLMFLSVTAVTAVHFG
jgi:hypothetical protein